MNRSSWHIPGSYLLLSVALYVSMGILLEADSAVLLRMALVPAGNLLVQGCLPH